MATVEFLNRCGFVAASSGTGSFVVSAAVDGMYAPESCENPSVSDGGTYRYFAESADKLEHEEGYGVYTDSTNTLTRAVILSSSNSGAAVDFTDSPNVYMGCALAQDVPTGFETLIVNIVGSWAEPMWPIAQPGAVQLDGSLITADGVWLSSFSVANHPYVVEIEFENLAGVVSGDTVEFDNMDLLEVAEFPALKIIDAECEFYNGSVETISLPELVVVTRDFSFNDSESLTAIDLPSLVGAGGDFHASFCAALTSLEAPALTSIGGSSEISNDSNLDVIDLSALERVQGYLAIYDVGSGLTDLDLGSLVFAGGILIANSSSLTTLDLTALETTDGETYFNELTALTSLDLSALTTIYDNLNIQNNTVLASIDLSALTLVGFTAITYNAALTSIDLSALEEVADSFYFDDNPSLTSLTLPSIVWINGAVHAVNNMDALATFSFGSGLLRVDGDVTLVNCALNEASVDNVLVRLAALDGTGGTTSYDSHDVILTGGTTASPSSTGLAAKAVLEGRGNSVAVN